MGSRPLNAHSLGRALCVNTASASAATIGGDVCSFGHRMASVACTSAIYWALNCIPCSSFTDPPDSTDIQRIEARCHGSRPIDRIARCVTIGCTREAFWRGMTPMKSSGGSSGGDEGLRRAPTLRGLRRGFIQAAVSTLPACGERERLRGLTELRVTERVPLLSTAARLWSEEASTATPRRLPRAQGGAVIQH